LKDCFGRCINLSQTSTLPNKHTEIRYENTQKLSYTNIYIILSSIVTIEDEEEEMNRSEEENDFPVIERVMSNDRDDVRGTDSDVDEEELERLLGAKEKKPVMRMYADELEEKQKVHRY
jgi:hypothetical protein